jgi:hypothetical protein
MNYASLVTAIQQYIEAGDTDFVANIPNFVKAAELKIYNTVQFPSLRKNVTSNCTTGNKYLSTPADYLSTYSLAVVDPTTGDYSFLLNKDVNYLREAFPSPSSTGKPTHYALFGPTTTTALVITNELTLILAPTPNAAYVVELHYFYYPESIVTAGTTWLGDNFDSALLYGSLVEANMFIKGEADMTATYQKQYMEALALAKRLGDGLERGDAYRSGQFRMPVT